MSCLDTLVASINVMEKQCYVAFEFMHGVYSKQIARVMYNENYLTFVAMLLETNAMYVFNHNCMDSS